MGGEGQKTSTDDVYREVFIQEVAPRDGFQNISEWIPTEAKVHVVNEVLAAGVPIVEVTSFSHPAWIPQLKDAEEVLAQIERRHDAKLVALVPNVRGVERAVKAGVDAVSLTISASETHNRKNLNRTRAESLARAAEAMRVAVAGGLEFNGGVATAFGCPMEGEVPLKELEAVVSRYVELGIRTIRFGDSTGMANPRQVRETMTYFRRHYPDVTFILHFHNTRGMGLANVLAGLDAGITHFDGSIGGIGGCPYAPGATGNIDTIDLVHMLHEMGIATGIDLDRLIAVGRYMQELLEHQLYSSVLVAGKTKDLRDPSEVGTPCT